METKTLFNHYKKLVSRKEAVMFFSAGTNYEHADFGRGRKRAIEAIKNGGYLAVAAHSWGGRLAIGCEPNQVYADQYLDGQYGARFEMYDMKRLKKPLYVEFSSASSGTKASALFTPHCKTVWLEMDTVCDSDGCEYQGAYYNSFMSLKDLLEEDEEPMESSEEKHVPVSRIYEPEGVIGIDD